MSFSVLGDVNPLAVIVATIAFFALGGLWYSPILFGKQWSGAVGREQPAGETPAATMYLVPLATCLTSTIGLAMLTVATDTDTLGEGVVLGLVSGVLVAGSALLVTGFFDPKKPQPMVWVGITAGYHVVGYLVVAIILALWT